MFRHKLLVAVHALGYRLSSRRFIGGMSVRMLLSAAEEWDAVMPKLSSALGQIARFAPVRFARMLADTDGIWVFGDVGAIGAWEYRLRAIRLRTSYCADPNVTTAQLACTIVHEATHAYLWRLGFRYPEHQRVQIERICLRSERAFLRRVEGEESLLEWKRGLPDLEDQLTDQAFRSRALEELRQLETPKWAMRFLGVRTDEIAGEPVCDELLPHERGK